MITIVIFQFSLLYYIIIFMPTLLKLFMRQILVGHEAVGPLYVLAAPTAADPGLEAFEKKGMVMNLLQNLLRFFF